MKKTYNVHSPLDLEFDILRALTRALRMQVKALKLDLDLVKKWLAGCGDLGKMIEGEVLRLNLERHINNLCQRLLAVTMQLVDLLVRAWVAECELEVVATNFREVRGGLPQYELMIYFNLSRDGPKVWRLFRSIQLLEECGEVMIKIELVTGPLTVDADIAEVVFQ